MGPQQGFRDQDQALIDTARTIVGTGGLLMNGRQALLSTVSAIPVLFMPAAAAAQSITLDPPPVRQPLDEHGVDLSGGGIVAPSSTLSIGGEEGLVHSRFRVGNG